MMSPSAIMMLAYPLACALAAAPLTWSLIHLASPLGMVDVPNERSSHHRPVPRGGGLAIVVPCSIVAAVLALTGVIADHVAMALLGAVAIAAVGLIDDLRGVSALARLAVHLFASAWAVAWLWPLAPQPFLGAWVEFGWIGWACTVIGLVWAVNLFNFMDGIDGLAASQAIFMLGAAAVIGPGQPGLGLLGLCIAGACAGFLVFNWSPARIFMGDVGSGFLGFTIGVLALSSLQGISMNFWTWLVLGALFLADATVTLARRILRRERWFEAHRLHAYQKLAWRWHSHSRVTTAWSVSNLCVILPAAYATTAVGDGSLIGSTVLVLAFAFMVLLGAGVRDR